MSAKDFDVGYVRYIGFSKLDSFEKSRIESIVAQHVEKVKKYADFLGLRLHLKLLHENKAVGKQEPINQIDAVLETNKGHFSAIASNRNPYSAVSDVMENLLSQLQHKHPHKEEWKEQRKRRRS